MKRASPESLARIVPFLGELRRRPGLTEKKPGIFYCRGKAFQHLHEDAAGLFADLRFVEGWRRFPANSAKDWKARLAAVDGVNGAALR
ncbi:MAG: hypothetical protein HYR63_14785 [Proteobacteria bacterium]|nr:hypothetical protein [Pseudomonadota bacterium]MBI3498753.1 hypothetical protein [Pseudomonadota bacterium]